MDQIIEKWEVDIKEWRNEFEEDIKKTQNNIKTQESMILKRGFKDPSNYLKITTRFELILKKIMEIDNSEIKETIEEKRSYFIRNQINFDHTNFLGSKSYLKKLLQSEFSFDENHLEIEIKETIRILKNKTKLRCLEWYAKANGINLPKIDIAAYKKWEEMMNYTLNLC
jgi:hypothetical protein